MNPESRTNTLERLLPTEIPLFPLPDHVLLPKVPAPYRVFEPRYRALVEHLLEEPEDQRWILVPRLAPGWKSDYHGHPPVHEIATLGRITTCESLAGGHYFILVEGVARVRLEENTSDHAFRTARVQLVPDVPHRRDSPEVKRSMELLVQSVFTLVQLVGSSATDLTEAVADMRHPEALVYRLGASVLDLPDERQALLEERCLLARSQAIVLALSDLIALSASHMGAPTSA